MDEPLYQLFRDCIVRLRTPSDRGTGFFVAPGLILTCAHVVKGADASSIEVHWQNQPPPDPTGIKVLDIEWPDLALLEVPIRDHPCVYLDREAQPGHQLYSYGYPDANRDGSSITVECEGPSDNGRFLTIKDENVRPGFSGAPLLNRHTRKVCGIIKSERNLTVNTAPKILKGLGGQAIPTAVIFEQWSELEGQNREFHQQQNHWTKLISPPASHPVNPEPNSFTRLSRREFQNRRDLLAQVNNEVEGRLKQSLSDMVLINLSKEEQAHQVRHYWDLEVKVSNQQSAELLPNTDIIKVFDQAKGKLLILGAPGSGKTTSQLELARELITRAENNIDEPIPILFNLSAWQGHKQTIAQWLVNTLNLKYGVRLDIGKQWLEERQLLPLLDGLDELESNKQKQCILTINQFLQGEYRPNHIVVCSRRLEYELCGTKLLLNSAVCLHSLGDRQIYQYLVNVKRLDLWQSIEGDRRLLELAKLPLLLRVMTLVFVDEESSDRELQRLRSAEERPQYLGDAYVQRMLAREIDSKWYSKGREPTPQQTIRWLTWLAKMQKQQSQTEFLIEKIQPTCLQPGIEKWMYCVGVSLIAGIFVELAFGLIIGLLAGSHSTEMIIALLSGLLVGLVSSFSQEIKLFENIRWSWSCKKAGEPVMVGLAGGLIIGLIIGLIGKQISLPVGEFFTSLKFGLITGLFAAVIGGLFSGLIGSDIETKTLPNQGILQSANNAGIFTLIFFSLFSIPIFILQLPTFSPPLAALLGLVSLYAGGLACIQHFTLRIILWCNGYAPWNYAYFLNYANERMFLQKVGGRYQFIHELLRQSLAEKEQSYSQKIGKSWIFWFKCTVIAISLICLGTFSLFIPLSTDSWRVDSELAKIMEQRWRENDYLISDKLAYYFGSIQRGDFILYKTNKDSFKQKMSYPQQVIGIPGDVVEIKYGNIYINKKPLNSNQFQFNIGIDQRYKTKPIPIDFYLIIENDRKNKPGAFTEVLVHKNDITRRVIFRYWPINRIGKPDSYREN